MHCRSMIGMIIAFRFRFKRGSFIISLFRYHLVYPCRVLFLFTVFMFMTAFPFLSLVFRTTIGTACCACTVEYRLQDVCVVNATARGSLGSAFRTSGPIPVRFFASLRTHWPHISFLYIRYCTILLTSIHLGRSLYSYLRRSSHYCRPQSSCSSD